MVQIDKIIFDLNTRIKQLFSDFNGIYLYGSYANNNTNPNSDIDIVAIFETSLPREKRMDLWEIIGEFEAETDQVFDIHPMTLSELKRNPVYYNQVVNKGIYYGI